MTLRDLEEIVAHIRQHSDDTVPVFVRTTVLCLDGEREIARPISRVRIAHNIGQAGPCIVIEAF